MTALLTCSICGRTFITWTRYSAHVELEEENSFDDIMPQGAKDIPTTVKRSW